MRAHDGDGEDLSRFRYYTGAPLQRLDPEARCPVLFRDLGAAAMGRYLRGELPRLAGPLTPLLFMRSPDYREPYVDHADIGRLVFLAPREIDVWFSGVPHVYVARASCRPRAETVAFVPNMQALSAAAEVAGQAADAAALRESLGGKDYDLACAEALERIEHVNAEHALAERHAEPLRVAFSAPDGRRRGRARELLARLALTESDLCSAWHHLPGARRALVLQRLQTIEPHELEALR